MNIGPMELAIIVFIALVVFGPKRLPEIGRSIGAGIRELKTTVSDNDPREEIRSTLAAADPREDIRAPVAPAGAGDQSRRPPDRS